MPSLPIFFILLEIKITWINGISRARAKSSAARALLMTRFASSGVAGIVATSMSRWPRCMSMVTSAVSFASRCNSLCSPAKRLARPRISKLAMLESVGGGGGVALQAFVVHAHHGRHARGIAVEIGERADHLGGEADVGDRQRVAVAVAAGLLLLREMALDGFEGRQGPVREPESAARFLSPPFLFHL